MKIFQHPLFEIKLFFAGKGVLIYYHDHGQAILINNIKFGRIKFIELDKIGNTDKAIFCDSGIAVGGKFRYNSPYYRNIHSFTALENSTILEIQFSNNNKQSPCRFYDIDRKEGNVFYLKQKKCSPWFSIRLPYFGIFRNETALRDRIE